MRYYRLYSLILILTICVSTYIVYDRSFNMPAKKAYNDGTMSYGYYYSDRSKLFGDVLARFAPTQSNKNIDNLTTDNHEKSSNKSINVDTVANHNEQVTSNNVADFSGRDKNFDYSQYIITATPEEAQSDDDIHNTDTAVTQNEGSNERFFALVKVDKVNKSTRLNQFTPPVRLSDDNMSGTDVIQTATVSEPVTEKPNTKPINVTISEDIRRCSSPTSALQKYSEDVHIKLISVDRQLYAIDREFNVSEFSNTSCTWSSVELNYPDKPSARTEQSISVVNDKIYIFGGWSYGSQYFNDIWFYDTVSKMWVEEPFAKKMPARAYHSATVVDDKIYYYGGYNGSFLNDIWVFNTRRNKWDNIKTATSPPATGYHKTVLMADNIYVTDGYDMSGGMVNDIWVFNIKNSNWRSIYAGSDSDKYALINDDVISGGSKARNSDATANNKYIDRYGRGYANDAQNTSTRVSAPKIIFESSDIEISTEYEYVIDNDLVYTNDVKRKYVLYDDEKEKKVAPIDYNIDIYYTRPDTSIQHK